MALFDPERKRIVIRVVYDGPGFAGKTTNLQRLCTSFAAWRRSEMVSPNTLGERTQYFDWLEVDGGLLRSYPIRAQLLTVPGQRELTLRRQFVIERADVVVFVADSAPDSIPEARQFYAELCEQLAALPEPVPVVFQANKQDLPGALRPAKVAREVCGGLRKPAQVKGSAAARDRGVKQTLAVALRIGANAIRERWAREDPRSKAGSVDDAGSTLAALEHHERLRARGRAVDLRPSLPGPELNADRLWPATTARVLLERLAGIEMRPRSEPGRPELFVYEGSDPQGGVRWRATTSTDRLFSDPREAVELTRVLASRMVALASWLPEPSALVRVDDPTGAGTWVWTVEPVLESLAARLEHADPTVRRAALARYAEVLVGAEALAERDGVAVTLGPESFGVQRDDRERTRYIGDALEPGREVALVEAALDVAGRFVADELALADLCEGLCLGLHRAPVDPARRAGLAEELRARELPAALVPLRDALLMVLRRPARPA